MMMMMMMMIYCSYWVVALVIGCGDIAVNINDDCQ
jgi:hypothetical protein